MNRSGFKSIAIFEAAKGVLALVVGLGLHMFSGESFRGLAESLVMHSHLNPASDFPQVFVTVAEDLSRTNLVLIAFGALTYSVVRFVEAYGLWRGLPWTEWLALVSGAIYLPVELYDFFENPNGLTIVFLLANGLVVLSIGLMLKSRVKF